MRRRHIRAGNSHVLPNRDELNQMELACDCSDTAVWVLALCRQSNWFALLDVPGLSACPASRQG